MKPCASWCRGLSTDPRETPRKLVQEGMFRELVPEDVIGKPFELSCANVGRWWRRRKHKMEKASRRSWTDYVNSPRTKELREYALREFWEIFVDDGPFFCDACFKHANVQP